MRLLFLNFKNTILEYEYTEGMQIDIYNMNHRAKSSKSISPYILATNTFLITLSTISICSSQAGTKCILHLGQLRSLFHVTFHLNFAGCINCMRFIKTKSEEESYHKQKHRKRDNYSLDELLGLLGHLLQCCIPNNTKNKGLCRWESRQIEVEIVIMRALNITFYKHLRASVYAMFWITDIARAILLVDSCLRYNASNFKHRQVQRVLQLYELTT